MSGETERVSEKVRADLALYHTNIGAHFAVCGCHDSWDQCPCAEGGHFDGCDCCPLNKGICGPRRNRPTTDGPQ